MPENTLEAKKDGLSQLQDGCWVLRLKVHPDDMLTDLMKLPMGTRLKVAVWLINDDESLVATTTPASHKLAEQSGILCNENLFRRFLWENHTEDFDTMPNEDEAAVIVRELCGVGSRSELDTNEQAGTAWRKLKAEYEGWKQI